MGKKKTLLMIIIIGVVLAGAIFLLLPSEEEPLGLAWDWGVGQNIDGGHFPLGYTIQEIEVCNHWKCPWTECGIRGEVTFIDPDGVSHGPWTATGTWPSEQWPDDDYPNTGCGYTLNKPGKWTISVYYEERGCNLDPIKGWHECGTVTGTFWVGDPTVCYKCNENYEVEQHNIYDYECPPGMSDTPPDCTKPIVTCYKCIDNALMYDDYEIECPDSWYTEDELQNMLGYCTALPYQGNGTVTFSSYCNLDCVFPAVTLENGKTYIIGNIQNMSCPDESFLYNGQTFTEGEKVYVSGIISGEKCSEGNYSQSSETYNKVILWEFYSLEPPDDVPDEGWSVPGFDIIIMMFAFMAVIILIRMKKK